MQFALQGVLVFLERGSIMELPRCKIRAGEHWTYQARFENDGQGGLQVVYLTVTLCGRLLEKPFGMHGHSCCNF